MPRLLSYSLFVALLTISTSSNAKIYKWVDEAGKTHYTATPPPQNIESKEMKVKNGQASESKSTKAEPKKELTKDEQKEITADAEEDCKEAIEKLPAIFENIEDITKMAYSFGSISKEDHDKTIGEIEKAKETKPTLSECLTDYKEDETDRELVQCLADTNEISAFACLKQHAEKKQ